MNTKKITPPETAPCIEHCAHGTPWMKNGRCMFRESIDADFCFHRCTVPAPEVARPEPTLHQRFLNWWQPWRQIHSFPHDDRALEDAWIAGFSEHNQITCAVGTAPAPEATTYSLLLKRLAERHNLIDNGAGRCPLCEWGGKDTHRSDCPFILAAELTTAPVEAPAVAETPLTVETALIDLQNLFPLASHVEIVEGTYLTTENWGSADRNKRFSIGIHQPECIGHEFDGSTLLEAMQKVREYAERINQ